MHAYVPDDGGNSAGEYDDDIPPELWMKDCVECSEPEDHPIHAVRIVHIPNEVVQAAVRPLGYVALADRPANLSGLVGEGLIVLALNVQGGYPVGPWVTWLLKDCLYLGHYSDIEENAWIDFWERRRFEQSTTA